MSRKSKKPKDQPLNAKALKAVVAQRVLGEALDIAKLRADVEAGRATGAGLSLGKSVYLNSHGEIVPVNSHHVSFRTFRHEVGVEECAHELHVDDGALWDTRLESHLGKVTRVKDQRLECVEAEVRKSPRTGWYELWSTYQFVCEYTGEILTTTVCHAPNGQWLAGKDSKPKRTVRNAMMILARCDRRWRKIYGLRNDTESWFSWLKLQLLDDKRAPSLDLNHQLLDVLYAGLITNAITRFNHRRERHL